MTTYTVTIAPTSDTLTATEDKILTAYSLALAGCLALRLDADADLRRDLDFVAVSLGHLAASELEAEGGVAQGIAGDTTVTRIQWRYLDEVTA